MPTIAISDIDFGNFEFEQQMIEAAGITFVGFSGPDACDPHVIIEHLAEVNANGAITSYGLYTAEVFEALPQLRVVSKTGTGVDNIDVVAATANGTAVCNVPGYGTEAVSDHAIALTLGVLRRIAQTDADVRAGIWDYQRHRPLGQVRGRTFGVFGMGHIGHAVAEKARGLGFEVIVWDRKGIPGQLTPEGFPYVAFEDALKQSDVISFHTALTPDTYHLLNAQNITLLKPDTIVVNTSRGAVIDVDAVADALKADKLFGAGIDVFEIEPLPMDAPIRSAPNVILTPHDGYWSEESGVDLRTRCTQNAIDVVLGRMPESCLNPQVLKVD